MRHPTTLSQLEEFERIAYETGLRHEALRAEWERRETTKKLQRPPVFVMKISVATFLARLEREIKEMREARLKSHE